MAISEQSLLGIELGEHEIRVLELKHRSGRAFVTRVAYAATPIGSIVQGEITQLTAVEYTVKHLLNELGIGSGAKAVIGIPSGGSALQTITVPTAPDSELPSIVAGEVEHYNIVKGAGGAHAYIKLAPAIKTNESQPVRVTVIAAENHVIQAIRALAISCGLHLVAVEPAEYGMLRTILSSRADGGDAILVMVCEHAADLAFVHAGKPHFYRRTDIGSRMLSHVAIPAGVADDRVIEEGPIHEAAGDMLVAEVRRTIEYVEREFAPTFQVDRICLAIDAVDLEPLADYLREHVGVPVALVNAPAGDAASKAMRDQMLGQDGFRYASAYGLAARNLPQISKVIPNLDLFAKERKREAYQAERRNIYVSGAVSLLALVLGGIGYGLFRSEAVRIETRTATVHQQVESLTTSATLALEARKQAAEQYRLLSREGVPVGYILDYVATSLFPGIGIREVTVDPTLVVGISGEAVREPEMISVVEALQKSPLLSNVHVKSFERVGRKPSIGLKFEIAATTVSGERIRHPKDKAEVRK
ncbi:MAG: hypothetical protein U0S12_14540 [Fimbriimonadales bacterium]